MDTKQQIVEVFFNREKELEYIDEKLNILVSNLARNNETDKYFPAHFALYFQGVGGIGKTSMLLQIKDRASKKGPLGLAFIDFGENGKYKEQSGRNNIVKDIVEQLKIDVKYETDDLDNFIGDKIIKQLKTNQRKNSIVLLFDTLEDVSPDNFKWLQEQLVVPLVNEWQVMIVYASRKKIIESNLYFPWDIRRYLKSFSLEPFTPSQTKEHLRELFNDETRKLPKDFMELTGGVPGLNKKLYKLMVANPENPDDLTYLEHIVEETIFTEKGGARLYKNDLLFIAVCRQFENRLVDSLLSSNDMAWRKFDDDIKSTSGLIQKLLTTTLLENYPDGYGYVFAMNYRRIVDRYFRHTNISKHLSMHIYCYEWYEKEVEKGDWVALADQIYHLVGAWFDLSYYSIPENELTKHTNRIPNSNNRGKFLETLLKEKLETASTKDRGATIVNKIKSVLKGEEFSWFMSQSEIDNLINICDELQTK